MNYLVFALLTITLAACQATAEKSAVQSPITIENLNVDAGDNGVESPDSVVPLGSKLTIPSFWINTIGIPRNPFLAGGRYITNVKEYSFRIGGIQTGASIEGQTTISYSIVDIKAYLLNDNEGYIFHLEDNGQALLRSGGEDFISNPSGRFTYTGFNTAVSKSFGEWEGLGSFIMDVDFDNGFGYLKGETSYFNTYESNWTSDIEGRFILDRIGGFVGSDLRLRVDNVVSGAFLRGSFHGSGATGVSGVYDGLGSNSDVIGAIAGARNNKKLSSPDASN